MGARPEILTVGHSTHSAERFRDLVSGHEAAVVADVRRYPGSRRNPQFNADALEALLAEADIGYEAMGTGLGGRRKAPAGGPPSGWRVAGFAAYAAYMQTPEFDVALARLEELARARRTAIMCAEGQWRRCHRRLISDVLTARGWRVVHIRPDGRAEEHELPDFAVVEGRGVLYGGQRSLDV